MLQYTGSLVSGLVEAAIGGVAMNFGLNTSCRVIARGSMYLFAAAVFWGWIFEGIAPDMFDIIGSAIAIAGVIIIYYMPRKGEKAIWSK